MPGKPITRTGFFQGHFLIMSLFVGVSIISGEYLLADDALQPVHLFLLNVLALSALLFNSWLWSFILLRNSAKKRSPALTERSSY